MYFDLTRGGGVTLGGHLLRDKQIQFTKLKASEKLRTKCDHKASRDHLKGQYGDQQTWRSAVFEAAIIVSEI